MNHISQQICKTVLASVPLRLDGLVNLSQAGSGPTNDNVITAANILTFGAEFDNSRIIGLDVEADWVYIKEPEEEKPLPDIYWVPQSGNKTVPAGAIEAETHDDNLAYLLNSDEPVPEGSIVYVNEQYFRKATANQPGGNITALVLFGGSVDIGYVYDVGDGDGDKTYLFKWQRVTEGAFVYPYGVRTWYKLIMEDKKLKGKPVDSTIKIREPGSSEWQPGYLVDGKAFTGQGTRPVDGAIIDMGDKRGTQDSRYLEFHADPDDKYGGSSTPYEMPAGGVWPVGGDGGKISSGLRYPYRNVSDDSHAGIDIQAPEGTEVYASYAGTVTKAEKPFAVNVASGYGYGNQVIVTDENKVEYLYAHLSDLNVALDDVVMAGDVVGYVGTTGHSYANHLHFEVRINGQHVDPKDYIDVTGRPYDAEGYLIKEGITT